MCFSSTASFIAAVITAGVGIAVLRRVDKPRDLALAAAPMIFAAQQTIEGLLWLDLPLTAGGSGQASLILLYLFFAYFFWPIYVPIAVLLVEPTKGRRGVQLFCLAVGLGLSAHLLSWILTHTSGAYIEGEHIVYETGYHASVPVALAYLTATGLPLIVSSHRWVLSLGTVTLIGSVVAYIFYWEAFISVWCFFAAAASVMLLCHFEGARRWRLRVAGISSGAMA